jgi:Family of unknown function (DUF6064)
MPFTPEQFLDLFGRYNEALWPIEIALWVTSAGVLLLLVRPGPVSARSIAGVLAFHWAWSAIAYHAAFFSTINPAAWFFAALFLFEAGCLLWLGVIRARIHFTVRPTAWHAVGYAFVAYGLLYPAISLSTGHVWPRAPMFAVPCPTTLLTAGLLLATDRPLPPVLVVAPILWSLLAVSAALQFGVWGDVALPVAGAALALRVAVQIVTPRRRTLPPAVVDK